MVGAFHSVFGWVVVGLCALSGLYGIILAIAKRTPGGFFRGAMTVAVGALLLQVVLGVASMNLEERDPGNQHLFYGVVAATTLGFAYIYRIQFSRRPALYYGLLMLFLMGLAIRGIMTFGNNF